MQFVILGLIFFRLAGPGYNVEVVAKDKKIIGRGNKENDIIIYIF